MSLVFLAFISLHSAIAQQADSCVDGVSLLQVDLSIKQRHPLSEPRENKWFNWDARNSHLGFPRIAPNSSNPAEFTAADRADDLARVWTHLGEHWWMEFLDGQFHKDGPHALDHSWENVAQGQDGEFFLHAQEIYNRFSDASLWHWERRFTPEVMAQMNANFRGSSCANKSCDEMFLEDSRRQQLKTLLSDYYNDTMQLKGLSRSIRVRKGFTRLAHLAGSLAKLHPFRDANSRMRMLLLQVESVRLGGHPLVLWSFKDDMYTAIKACEHVAKDQCNYWNQMSNIVLNGWCAWEFVAATGKPPFPTGQYYESYDPSTESCLKTPVQKPAPEVNYWNVLKGKGLTGVVLQTPKE